MRAGGLVSDGRWMRCKVSAHIPALLLVEPGRIASDGLEASAGHHLACVSCVRDPRSSSRIESRRYFFQGWLLAASDEPRLWLWPCWGVYKKG